MSLSTLRPDGTVTNEGTLTGGATAHAVLSDDSDSSYVRLDVEGEEVNVTFGDFTLPAGAVIESIRARVRCAHEVGSRALDIDVRSGATTLSSSTIYTPSLSPTTISASLATTGLTDAVVDAATVSVEHRDSLGGGLRIYEVYLDVTYRNQPTLTVTVGGTITNTNLPAVTWVGTFDE